jgi:hypothetical protein
MIAVTRKCLAPRVQPEFVDTHLLKVPAAIGVYRLFHAGLATQSHDAGLQ